MKLTAHKLITGLLFMSHFLQGQTLKPYSPDLDSLWSQDVFINKMSPDGNWVTFTEFFDHRENILHLSDSKGKRFKLEDRIWESFSKDSQWYAHLSKNNQLTLFNLLSAKQQKFDSVSSASFSTFGKFLAFSTKSGTDNNLSILELKNQKIYNIQHIKEFVWNPQEEKLIVQTSTKNQFSVQVFCTEKQTFNNLGILSDDSFTNFKWDKKGTSFIFQSNKKQQISIFHYSFSNGLAILDNKHLKKTFPAYNITNGELFISADGNTVFFNRKMEKPSLKQVEGIEVWDTESPVDYPRLSSDKSLSLLSTWNIQNQSIHAIETQELPSTFFNSDLSFALVYNSLTYEPLYNEHPYVDLYLKDLESGSLETVVSKVYLNRYQISISPKGKFIAYYKDDTWWLYDTVKKKTFNLDDLTGTIFKNTEFDYTGEAPPFEPAVWEENDKFLILNDTFDVYRIGLDNLDITRITSGKEKKRKYRLETNSLKVGQNRLKFLKGYFNYELTENQPVLLHCSDGNYNTGLAVWDGKEKVTDFLFESYDIKGAAFSPTLGFFFKKERFDEPPSILFSNFKKKQKPIYQSNQQLKEYDLGSSKTIRYSSQNGNELSGTLFYPADFVPEKKYPMIVIIYELLAGQVNNFRPPSMYEGNGFNILNYLNQGYFVLCPNIEYNHGAPGVSALQSVTAATEKALKNPAIDPQRLGLIGHSFGGYEAAFIATQTELFATVVAGAAPTNLESWYHTMGWYWGKSEMWRFENGQFRMRKPFFENKDSYYKNSPFHQVEHLKTPLLLWSGKIDYQVFWHQSIEMFLAMKRQKKEGKMLLYEDEGHVLLKKENKLHLNEFILNWFNGYLK